MNEGLHIAAGFAFEVARAKCSLLQRSHQQRGTISSLDKRLRRKKTFALLRDLSSRWLEPNVVWYSAAISKGCNGEGFGVSPGDTFEVA